MHEDDAGQDYAHRGGHGPGEAADRIADVGGHVDAHRARGGLADSEHIRKLGVSIPARAVREVIEEGQRGHTSADGEEADLEKLPEQLEEYHLPPSFPRLRQTSA